MRRRGGSAVGIHRFTKYSMNGAWPFFKNPMYLPKKGHTIRNSIESADEKSTYERI